VSLDLDGISLFIGTNASGRSNFFDASRVLQGIGYGLSIDEIFNGKPKSATSQVWEGILGGLQNAAFWAGGASSGVIAILVRCKDPSFEEELHYRIRIDTEPPCVLSEALSLGDTLIYRLFQPGVSNALDTSRPTLPQLAKSRDCTKDQAHLMENWSRLLSDSQFLNPSTSILRSYSSPNMVGRIG